MIRRPRLFRALIPLAAAFLLLGLVNSLDPLEPWQLPEDLAPPEELSLERLGENPLDVPEDEFAALQTGFDLVFSGDYRGGWDFFDDYTEDAPHSAVGPLGVSVTFLAARYVGASLPIDYDAAFQATAERLDRLVEEEGWTPWARALDAMHQGIDGLFASNRGEYLLLLERCRTVLEHLDALEEEAPEFVDVQLAGGLFDYWATVIAHELPYVPAFSDRRAVGLELMHEAAMSGSLLRGPAAWGLALSLVDAGYPEEALPWAEALVEHAPDSSLARMAWRLAADPEHGARWAESMRRAMRRSSADD